MSEQKFHRGNVVKIIIDNPLSSENDFKGDPDGKNVGRLAVIKGSYADQFGGDSRDNYTIIFKDDGNMMSWWYDWQLELVSEGGEHEIEECEKIRDEYVSRCSDVNYIKEVFLNNGPLAVNTTSILTLFREVKVPSSFNRTGEFFMLFHEWLRIYPMFEAIFKGDYETTLEYVNKVSEVGYGKHKDNIIEFYDKMNPKE